MTYECKTGALKDYHFALNGTLWFSLERIPNKEDGGLFGLPTPILPVFIALSVLSMGIIWHRKTPSTID
jgi:hypothetical protein